jgi:V8-like Glu-specific endopeptidase
MTKFTLNFAFIAVCLWAPVSFSSTPQTDIVYGEDNRIDTYQASAFFQKLAKSTAAMVPKEKIKIRGNTVELNGPELGQIFRLCEKERFYHQSFIANCSGFLVAPDIMVSAGHCYEDRSDCTQNQWVFNYKVDDEKQRHVSVSKNDVYGCKEVIAQSLTDKTDFAVIRLDRPVAGVTPVKLATKPAEVGAQVVLIGHPSGLPQKVSDNAVVKSVTETEFKATVDAFQINSGSAVFNATTGELMGILVRGLIDYRTNKQYQCTEVNTTVDTDNGEDISSWVQFKKFIPVE